MDKNKQAKRAKIVEVYGEELARFADNDGWIEKEFGLNLNSDNCELTTKEYNILGSYTQIKEVFRDSRLRGLEHNNGWNKVYDSFEESMGCKVHEAPDLIEGFFPELGRFFKIQVMEKGSVGYRIRDEKLREVFANAKTTHWREYNNNEPIY